MWGLLVWILVGDPLPTKLEQSWVVGVDGELEFSGALSLALDNTGLCYALDRTAGRVYVFNPSGELVREFGKKGEGPGEFHEPDAIAFDEQNHLHVMDSSIKKVLIFRADGEPIGEQRLPLNVQKIHRFSVTNKGNYIISCIRSNAQFRMRYELVMFSADISRETVFHTKALPQMESFRKQGNNPAYWVTFLKHKAATQVGGVPLMTAINGDRVVVSNGLRAAGQIVNAEGRPLAEFVREIPPTPFPAKAHRPYMEQIWTEMQSSPFLARRVTRSVLEQAVKSADLGDFLAPMNTLFPLYKGFAVLEHYDLLRQRGRLALFNGQGKLITTLPYSGPTGYFEGRDTALYLAGLNDDDLTTLIRYDLRTIDAM